MEFYEVGGCVRDRIMGQQSNDIDFVCVLTDRDVIKDTPFNTMRAELERRGFRIFKSDPKFFTVRAQFPKGFAGMFGEQYAQGQKSQYDRLTADFVLARKEGDYADGRRPEKVEPGTLMDDLRRRDFTMNAIAQDRNGATFDPFDGMRDIKDRKIRCVGSARERLTEDALRGLRAMRFSITKGFEIDDEIQNFMSTENFADLLRSVSKERMREEMEKMFAHDTFASMRLMSRFPSIMRVVFSDGLRLSATMKS